MHFITTKCTVTVVAVAATALDTNSHPTTPSTPNHFSFPPTPNTTEKTKQKTCLYVDRQTDRKDRWTVKRKTSQKTNSQTATILKQKPETEREKK